MEQQADPQVPLKKLFIGGLAPTTTQESLLAYFAPFGEVIECKVIVDKATGFNKGYGFVCLLHFGALVDRRILPVRLSLRTRQTRRLLLAQRRSTASCASASSRRLLSLSQPAVCIFLLSLCSFFLLLLSFCSFFLFADT
jgi:hypothetical protein